MVERALAGRELQAGAALALAVLARPQSAAFAPLLFGFLLLRGGGVGAIARTLPPLAIAALVTVAYNVHRFHDALEFGYKPPGDPGFTTPAARRRRRAAVLAGEVRRPVRARDRPRAARADRAVASRPR